MSTALIAREFNGFIIQQRQTDGYINATAMCVALNKEIFDWLRLDSTGELIEALARRLNVQANFIPENIRYSKNTMVYKNYPSLVVIKRGAPESGGGTWIHYKLGIPLAQWLSAEFALVVSDWVEEWLTTGKNPIISHQMPYHLQRYLANRQCIPYTHFSILTQLTLHLIAPLESLEYSLPENMLPDISEGLLFNRWLREEKNFDTDTLQTYVHTYADGRQVKAKLYPLELLPDFIKHFHEVWLPEHAPNYFATRDSNALPLMPKLLEARLTKSLTDLLKEHQIALSTQKVNKILLDLGFLEEKTRPSVTKGTKKYKALTEQGQVYGKNVVNPRKPEETHPVYYLETFPQLLAKILAWQTQH